MIQGQKINLRAVEREDLPQFVKWFNDPDIRRHLLVYLPFSMAQEEHWFEGFQDRIMRGEEVVLAIETLEHVHIGDCGLHRINWKDRHAELGIIIGAKEYWSQGFGTDAVRTLLSVAFDEMNLHRVYLRVDDDHLGAIRCYRKCGFQQEGITRDAIYREGRYYNHLVMSILQHEFQQNQCTSNEVKK